LRGVMADGFSDHVIDGHHRVRAAVATLDDGAAERLTGLTLSAFAAAASSAAR
jgi:hypothetical protein